MCCSALFKPFVFGDSVNITNNTKSPEGEHLRPDERKHQLWKATETTTVKWKKKLQ